MTTKAFLFAGGIQVQAQRLFPDVLSFTYELLIMPAADIELQAECSSGTAGIAGQRYIISPEHTGQRHTAGAGLSVGRNGISVYEHTHDYLPPVLVYPVQLDDWVHIALVYDNGTPQLYVNKQLVRTGRRSMKTVLPSGVFGALPPYGSFSGEAAFITLWDYAKPAADIGGTGKLPLVSWHPQQNGRTDGVLFVMNDIGGGTAHAQALRMRQCREPLYTLTYTAAAVTIGDRQTNQSYIIPLAPENRQLLHQVLQLLRITRIEISHLISFPLALPALSLLLDWLQQSGLPYTCHIYDFFYACPLFNLLNQQGVYCGNETDPAVCQPCLNRAVRIDIASWRRRFRTFLAGAARVVVPSRSTGEILQVYYPDIPVQVEPLPLQTELQHTFNPAFTRDARLGVTWIGNIQHNKGAAVLYELADVIRREGLPLRITVIGKTPQHEHYTSSDKILTVTGPYRTEDISALLAAHRTALVVMTSICPETFSYTTSEALRSGYPVLSFPLGATAEKVEQSGGGWVTEAISTASLLQELRRLLHDRGDIMKKADILLENGGEQHHVH